MAFNAEANLELISMLHKKGRDERDSCYKPMLDALLDHFSDAPEDQRSVFDISHRSEL